MMAPQSPTADSSGKASDSTMPETRMQMLTAGSEALRLRAALIESATESIDLQYYIWNPDPSGRYLLDRLCLAADRGVRIRLLLDGLNVIGHAVLFSALASHANADVRVFNPIESRQRLWMPALLRTFRRLNRRMHGKAMIVDAQWCIVGGRNIGDEYFDLSEGLNFRDRDVVLQGPLVGEVSRMFTAFWQSPLSVTLAPSTLPAQHPRSAIHVDDSQSARAMADGIAGVPADLHDAKAMLGVVQQSMLPAPAEWVFDPPPTLDQSDNAPTPQVCARVVSRLTQNVSRALLIESAYLVLDDQDLMHIRALIARQVDIRALTNSLSSNDVIANHAAYAGRRKAMLAAGLALYEWRPDAPLDTSSGIRLASHCGRTALHSKTVVFDQEILYVGSLNLNLRSKYFNAECGLIIRDATLAADVAAEILEGTDATHAWLVKLDTARRLVWHDGRTHPGQRRYRHDPQTAWIFRFVSWMISLLGVERFL